MFRQGRLLTFQYLTGLFFLVSFSPYSFAQSGVTGKVITVPDDYPKIQAAIDAAEKGTTVKIGPGNYEETIILKSGVNIKGLDANSIVIYCDARNGPVLKAENCNQPEISGLTLKHTGTENIPADFQGRFPVLLVNSSNLVISKCKIQKSASDGVLITDSNATINECLISDNNDYGLAAYGASTLSVSDNVFSGNGYNGLFLKGVHSAEVCRNTCSDNAHHGISVAEKSRVNLIQNNCANNKYNGIFFGLGATGSVKDNTCRSNDYQGISVTGEGTDVLIQRNTFSDNNKNGIYFDGKASGTVVENKCSNNLFHGISIADPCCAPSINNNYCFKNKRSGLYLTMPFRATPTGNIFEDNGEICWSEICELRNADKFEQLENAASRLRKQRCRYENGSWHLDYFYEALGEGWGGLEYFPQIKSTFEDWMKKYPDSVTPRIALARAYKSIAWKARGSGYANTVSEKGWQEFEDNLEKAEKYLIEAEDLNAPDPELYALWITVGMGMNKTDEEMDALFEKGIAIEKYYWSLYTNRAWSLTPRWGGKPGQLERFARQAAELTGQQEGQILYLKAADVLIGRKDFDPQELKQLDFSYKTLIQACDDLVRIYPDTNDSYPTNIRCFLACAYGDRDKAMRLFAEIGSNRHKKVWVKEEIFNKYKDWATGKTEKVEITDKSVGFWDSLKERLRR